MDYIIIADQHYRDQMIRGSLWLRNAIERTRGEHFPAKSLPGDTLVWGADRGAAVFAAREHSFSARQQAHRAALAMAAKEERRDRVVSRDPCPLCGVRGDIGCSHRRAV